MPLKFSAVNFFSNTCICISECAITGWAAPGPAITADYDAGEVYLNEGATTIYTIAAISDGVVHTYAIVSQPSAQLFEIAAAFTGVITLKVPNVLDGDAATLTHTLKIRYLHNVSLCIQILVKVIFSRTYGFLHPKKEIN